MFVEKHRGKCPAAERRIFNMPVSFRYRQKHQRDINGEKKRIKGRNGESSARMVALEWEIGCEMQREFLPFFVRIGRHPLMTGACGANGHTCVTFGCRD